VNDVPDNTLSTVLLSISYLCSVFLFYIFYNIKELQSHPATLTIGIIVCESLVTSAYLIGYNMCELELPTILAYTLFFDGSIQSKVRAQGLLTDVIAGFLMSFCYNMDILLISFLCYDLIFILKYPLAPKERRVKFYYMLAIFFCLVLAIIYFTTGDINVAGGLELIILVFSWASSFISIIYACLKLCRSSFNHEVRKIIVIRHVFFLMVFLIGNLITFYFIKEALDPDYVIPQGVNVLKYILVA